MFQITHDCYIYLLKLKDTETAGKLNDMTHTQSQVCGYTTEDEGREERERDDKGVEKAVVSFSHTVPDPRAVMIESLYQKTQDGRASHGS